MDALFDLLSMIGDAIVGLIDFVVSFVMDLVYIVQIIGSVIAQIPTFFSWLPSELSALLIIAVTVASIYTIAGRN